MKNRWDIYIELNNFETVDELCKVCEKYKNDFDVNAVYGSYMVDARSIVGVATLLDKTVRIVPILDDDVLLNKFYLDIEKIGAYIMEEKVELD